MKQLNYRWTPIAVTALMIALSSLAFVSAATATPKGIYSIFYDCPLGTPGVYQCQAGQTTSGEFTIGTVKVPISRTITLQAGQVPNGEEFGAFLVPASDGNTLSKTELNVPGGLTDFVSCDEIKGAGLGVVLERASCKAATQNPATMRVTATTELAAGAQNTPTLNIISLLSASGTAVKLPIKIHLNNQLLGSSCYIGSDAHPIVLKLTTGTTAPSPPNQSISGSVGLGQLISEEGPEMLRISKNSLVDNTFSVPGAQGCGGVYSPLITPILNAKLKLPSPTGKNKAILSGTLNSISGISLRALEESG